MITTILKEVIRGKSLSRTLTNIELREFNITGKVVDIGGQKEESQYRFLNIGDAEIKTVNIEKSFKPDYLINIEKDMLPVNDLSQDTVLCFNLLEHLFDEKNVLSESYRILKKGGCLLGSVPFLVNVHPDPHDYRRFTAEFLRKILAGQGFKDVLIKPISRGPYTSAYSQVEFTIPVIIRPLFIFLIFPLDYIINLLKPKLKLKDKFVLAYIFYAKK